MPINKGNVTVGRLYRFRMEENSSLNDFVGVVMDKEDKEAAIEVCWNDNGTLERMKLPTAVVSEAQLLEQANSPIIRREMREVVAAMQKYRESPKGRFQTEAEALEGVEYLNAPEAASYFLTQFYPYALFNGLPYVLKRRSVCRLAFDLLLYAIIDCSEQVETYPFAFLPYFPDQTNLHAAINMEVMRRVSRDLYRPRFKRVYHDDSEDRFVGVITEYVSTAGANSHRGIIAVNDEIQFKFSRSNIADSRLVSILGSGLANAGRIEVSFAIGMWSESELHACRICPTDLTVQMARQMGVSMDESNEDTPKTYMDSALCPPRRYPDKLKSLLTWMKSGANPNCPRPTLCGVVASCEPIADGTDAFVGTIESNHNYYQFTDKQICDPALWELRADLVGQKVAFEAAFNPEAEEVCIYADLIRTEANAKQFASPVYSPDTLWHPALLQTVSADEAQGENRPGYRPLQPWLPALDELACSGCRGTLTLHPNSKRGWIDVRLNGAVVQCQLVFEQVQDDFLYAFLHSTLRRREEIDWSKIPVFCVPRAHYGRKDIYHADHVILTPEGRALLMKRYGFRLPLLAKREIPMLVPRKWFIPMPIQSVLRVTDAVKRKNLMAQLAAAGPVFEMEEKSRGKLRWPVESVHWELAGAGGRTVAIENNGNWPSELTPRRGQSLNVEYFLRLAPAGGLYPYGLSLYQIPFEEMAETASDANESFDGPMFEGYGVILPHKPDKPGFIGPSFSTVAYLKNEVARKRSNSGGFGEGFVNTREKGVAIFQRNQLPLAINKDRIHVVKYTARDEQDDQYSCRLVVSVEEYASFPYSEYGYVRVDDEGNITAVPLFRALANILVYQDVDLIMKDGSEITGIIHSWDEKKDTFLVQVQDDGVAQYITAPLDDVQDVRIYGTITSTNQTDHGRINNFFFFHVNSFRIAADVSQMRRGTRVSFRLHGTKKDNGFDASDIVVVRPEIRKDCRLVERYEDGTFGIEDPALEGSAAGKIQRIRIFNLPASLNLDYHGRRVDLKKVRQEGAVLWYADGSLRDIPIDSGSIRLDEQFPLAERNVQFGLITDYDKQAEEVELRTSLNYSTQKDQQLLDQIPNVFRHQEPDTRQYLYVVRYYRTTDGDTVYEMVARIVKGYPLKSVLIENSLLSLEKQLDEYIDYREGEYLYIEDRLDMDSKVVRVVERYPDGSVRVDDSSVNLEGYQIYRFGVLTDFDDELNVGVLNNGMQFHFSLMEQRSYNIVKTAKKQMQVLYTCENRRITSVNRLRNEVLELIPWQAGVVVDCINDEKLRLRCVEVEQNALRFRHYLSIQSDAYVSAQVKREALQNAPVYIRAVYLPMKNEDSEELLGVALDINCTDEVHMQIEYDSTQDVYVVDKKTPYKTVVEGSADVLEQYLGREVSLHYNVKGTKLTADLLDDGKNVSESKTDYDDVNLIDGTDIFSTGLVRFLEKQMGAFDDTIDVDQQIGWIWNNIQSESNKNIRIAFCARQKYQGEGNFSILRAVRSTTARKTMLYGIRKRMGEILADRYPNLDEYCYYAITYAQAFDGENVYLRNLRLVLSADFCEMDQIIRMAGKDYDVFELDVKRMLEGAPVRNSGNFLSHLIQLDGRYIDYFIRHFGAECRNIQGLPAELKNDFDEAIHRCRAEYRDEKKKLLRVLEKDFAISDVSKFNIDSIVKYSCTTDQKRLKVFADSWRELYLAQTNDYGKSEADYLKIYQELEDLNQEIQEHPTVEAVELLCNTGSLMRLLTIVEGELNALYSNPQLIPHMECRLNHRSVDRTNAKIKILVSNTGLSAVQTAKRMTLALESDIEGVQIKRQPVLKGQLRAGVDVAFGEVIVYDGELEIDSSFHFGTEIHIAAVMKYEYVYSFQKGSKQTRTERKEFPLDLQIRKDEDRIPKENAVNPYKDCHRDVLMDDTMFYGRTVEMESIKQYILDRSETRFKPGGVIMIHGQKKCGKTSMIFQVRNALARREEPRQKAIVLYFKQFNTNCANYRTDPDIFYSNLYKSILNMMDLVIRREHRDLWNLLKENDLSIPKMTRVADDQMRWVFNDYIRSFYEFTQDEYQVVLVFDEFTRWITQLEADYRREQETNTAGGPSVKESLGFIPVLSELGFIQIIIGHANMMRALTALGAYNQSGLMALKIPLTALDEASAKALIKEPMETAFGVDVYNTPLGEKAVSLLMDLSGRSPFVLMRLCDSIFEYFTKKETPLYRSSELLDEDVQSIVDDCIRDPNLWSSSEFEFLLEEDGDNPGVIESRPIFQYLKTVALESQGINHDCSDKVICDALPGGQVQSMQVRDLLVDRHVLEHKNGRIKINVDLFRRYIVYRYGNSSQGGI